MPYIKNNRRSIYESQIQYLTQMIHNPGELNYVMTRLADGYITTHEKNYKTMNEIIGVIECMKQEFYRRVLAPYEDQKINDPESGDVYTQ